MHRPFTRRQALQNQAFLAALAETGNARLAARRLAVHRATYTKRRAKCPAFAARWDAALTAAQARLSSSPGFPGEGDRLKRGGGAAAKRPSNQPSRQPKPDPLRTKGGEPTLVRLKNGRVQLRLAQPGRMTKAAEQAFFRALSASANVRLSAAAAGFAHSSFYARRRRHRAFAREMRLALETGYTGLECAALMAAVPESHEHDDWRHNDPPPIPPMRPDQALQLLALHRKGVRDHWEQPHRRKRRGESAETYTARLRAMWSAEKSIEAEDEAIRRALRAAEKDRDRFAPEPPPPPLPALDQVTGWSKAKGKPPHHPRRALFGGWRLDDWEKRKRGKG